MTGGHLSIQDSNDENTHGLGSHACIDRHPTSHEWRTEISNIQDCSFPACKSINVTVQGTNHGSDYNHGPVYGNYAIFVSEDAQRFLTNIQQLAVTITEG